MSVDLNTPLVANSFAADMLPIIDADRTRNVSNIAQAILNCLNHNKNISLQMIEHGLRANSSFSYLIARERAPNMKVTNNLPYYFHISGQSDRSDDALKVKGDPLAYKQNLIRLAQAGFITI